MPNATQDAVVTLPGQIDGSLDAQRSGGGTAPTQQSSGTAPDPGRASSTNAVVEEAGLVLAEAADTSGEEQLKQINISMRGGSVKGRIGWRHFVYILFRLRGSVIPPVLPCSIVGGMFAYILVYIRDEVDESYETMHKMLPELDHPFVVQVFAIILSFVIVARTNFALKRYFGGMDDVHDMSCRWIDGFTSLLGFLRSSYDLHPEGSAKKEACVALGLAVLHWTTLAHALAINSLQVTQLGLDEKIWQDRLAIMKPPEHASLKAPWGDKYVVGGAGSGRPRRSMLSARSRGGMVKGAMTGDRRMSLEKKEVDGVSHLHEIKEKASDKKKRDLVKLGVYGDLNREEVIRLHGATDKTAIVLMWMEEAISRAQTQGVLLTAPPILARVYNELGSGLAGFNSAYRISLVPFPFCFAQMIGWCLVVFLFLCPAVAFVFTGGEILTSSLTFCCLMGFWGLNRIAMELENPFGCEANHLPMAELHHAFAEAIGEMHENPMPEYQWESAHGVYLGGIKRNLLE
eukprot:gnl/MRDRNA2_/MRDRNA2_67079_c0_seq3.p1 gnl/MRDRNA2_/MRDRNA2_67079_c0~~gnl/MRDRNA2_/MRDRNA2_67079_c0_seq3.p1  ORF type:complete len:516 (+),score=77.52 gnl/MRDRNA2_/MRDRNA2_67079_c0_seq3:79-1626(+)